MPDDFDPYYLWLGIPPDEQPADYYRLLGLRRFEANIEVIEAAADRQMSHVQRYKIGKHSALSQTVLNELSAAKICLLKPEKRAAYDQTLREVQAKQQAAVAAAAVPVQPNAPRVLPARKQLPQAAPSRIATSVSAQASTSPEPAAARPTRRRLRQVAPGWKKSHLITIGVASLAVVCVGLIVLLKNSGARPAAPLAKAKVALTKSEAAKSQRQLDVKKQAAEPAPPERIKVENAKSPAVQPTAREAPIATAQETAKPPGDALRLAEKATFEFIVPVEVSTVHVSNDGTIVLVNSKGAGQLFETASGRALGQLRPNSVNTGFLPDGRTPFAAPWGGPFVLLDPRTGDEAAKGFQGYQVKSVTFSRDGRLAAVGQMRGVVAITELASGQQKSFNVYDRNQEIEGLAFSPDGQRVLAVTKGAAKCIDVATGAETGTIEGLPSMKLVVLPDGRIVSAEREGGSGLEVRDFASGKIVGRWTGHTGSIKGLAASRRGDCVTTSADKTARSWNTASGESQLLWQHHSEITSAAFSANGQNLVIGGIDGAVKVWTALVAPAAVVVPSAPVKPAAAPEEKPSAPAMATAEREAAKRILESGGKVKVAIGNSKVEVSTVEDLPAIGVVTSATLRSSMKSDAGMEIVGNLVHIERLPLEYSSITSAGVARLANLKQVKFIHLYRAPVTDEGLITLGQLTSLEEVFLNSTRITNAGVAHLKGLKNLRTLALGEITNISGEALEPLAGIETLVRLDLNVTAVNDQDLEKLGRWTRLVSLDLFTTPITDVGLAHLHGLKNLVHLQVGRTKVTDAGVAAFQAAVPKCKVGRVP